MNSGINVAKVRSIGAIYVAEARMSAMLKWKGIIAIVAIGNPLFYLIAIGIGVGVLVSENSGTSGTGGVEYITFIAPALLASAAITGALDEAMFPVMEGFKWRKLFYAMNAGWEKVRCTPASLPCRREESFRIVRYFILRMIKTIVK